LSGTIKYSDSREEIVSRLHEVAQESYRILADNRYAIFFFGFNYYSELIEALEAAGFIVNPVPVVWSKGTRSTENPNVRYANAYDPAIVAMKGSPVFIRPGQTNVVEIPAVAAGTKLQVAQQPVALAEKFIKDMTSEGAVICDLFAGSGTTGEAAIRNKREAILFEREPAACAVIRARLGAL
jgi:DNA modification methylase